MPSTNYCTRLFYYCLGTKVLLTPLIVTTNSPLSLNDKILEIVSSTYFLVAGL